MARTKLGKSVIFRFRRFEIVLPVIVAIFALIATQRSANAQVVDVGQIFDEIDSQIQSLTEVVALRLRDPGCVSEDEKGVLGRYISQLYGILENDQKQLDAAKGQVAPAAYQDAEKRKSYRQGLLGRLFSRLALAPECSSFSRRRGGFIVGTYVIKTWQDLVAIEKLAGTGVTTFQSHDNHDPLGFGVWTGYKLYPWANNVFVMPFGSLDYYGMTVKHGFASGASLATTSNVGATLGVKVGPEMTPNVSVYGIAGASMLGETLRVNFFPAPSSTEALVFGATLGAGVSVRPDGFALFGQPAAFDVEYHRTWWQDAKYGQPNASPLFNYTYRRIDDTIRLGLHVEFGGTAASTLPALPALPGAK
jgi:hypothetical protein